MLTRLYFGYTIRTKRTYCKTIYCNDAHNEIENPKNDQNTAGGVRQGVLYAGWNSKYLLWTTELLQSEPVGYNNTNTSTLCTRGCQVFYILKVVTVHEYNIRCTHYLDFRIQIENDVERYLKSTCFRADKTHLSRRRCLIFCESTTTVRTLNNRDLGTPRWRLTRWSCIYVEQCDV